jgi:predicted signal transduction protein with EAL and GGDEF domain
VPHFGRDCSHVAAAGGFARARQIDPNQCAPGEDTTIVTAVIGIAHNLKLRVIAEGVETLEELTFLRATSATRCKVSILAGQCLKTRSRNCSEPGYENCGGRELP